MPGNLAHLAPKKNAATVRGVHQMNSGLRRVADMPDALTG
jgi:hypothetical protein